MGCGKCKLADGDVVRWDYTCDLGLDLDADMPVSYTHLHPGM